MDLPRFSTGRLFTEWDFHPVLTAALLLVLAGYGLGVRRAARRGLPWPLGRTLLFASGVVVVGVCLQSSLEVYGMVLGWAHMVQHLLMIMVAPALLVSGRPARLTTAASGRAGGEVMLRVMRSWPVSAVTHPLVVAALYSATIVATHLTSLMSTVMRSSSAHAVEMAVYLVVGYLFFLPIFGDEPIRWRLSHGGRLALVLLTMPVDTFTGVALMFTSAVPGATMMRPAWSGSMAGTMRTAGAVMWVGGDAIMLVMMLLVFAAWASDSDSASRGLGWMESAREATLTSRIGAPRAVSTVGADGDDDERLAAYNAWLAKLAERDDRAG